MMQRHLKYAVGDIVLDPNAVAERLNQACNGPEGVFMIRGVCQFGTAVSFLLLPLEAEEEPVEHYYLAPLEDSTADGIDTEIMNRWTAGFDVLGAIALGEEKHLLLLAGPDVP